MESQVAALTLVKLKHFHIVNSTSHTPYDVQALR
jgi:hypothetical protein